MSHMTTTGSRASVLHGNALKTTGGLRKKDLYMNKRGRIVSMKKSKSAKSWNPLKMMGLLSKTGEPFGARTIGKGKRYKGSRRRRRTYSRGGMQPLSYSNYPGDVPDFSNGTGDAFTSNPQIRALQAGAGKRRRSRGGGGMQPLQMTSLSAANSAPMVSENYGINSPLGRALNAAA